MLPPSPVRRRRRQWLASCPTLKANGYQPTELDLGTMTRLGARVRKANVSVDDHPSELRWKGRIQTVTVDSVVTWLRTLPNGCQAMGCPEARVALPEMGQ